MPEGQINITLWEIGQLGTTKTIYTQTYYLYNVYTFKFNTQVYNTTVTQVCNCTIDELSYRII